MGSKRELTERDRFWLDHEKVIAKSGQSAKAYATEQGLSLHALYQARKRLKAEGHLPSRKLAPAKQRRTRSGSGVAFSKIELASSPTRDLGYRLSLLQRDNQDGSRATIKMRKTSPWGHDGGRA